MGYDSPIKLITSQITSELVAGVDGEIFKAVQKVGVTVDRDELLRALAYDREQYQKEYADRDAEIVRCHDCRHNTGYGTGMWLTHPMCFLTGTRHTDDWFCADGERREHE